MRRATGLTRTVQGIEDQLVITLLVGAAVVISAGFAASDFVRARLSSFRNA